MSTARLRCASAASDARIVGEHLFGAGWLSYISRFQRDRHLAAWPRLIIGFGARPAIPGKWAAACAAFPAPARWPGESVALGDRPTQSRMPAADRPAASRW